MTQAEFAANPEIFCRMLAALTPDEREAFWASLRASGAFTQAEIEGLQELVSLYRMHMDQRYYKAVQEAVYEMYIASL